MSETVTFGEATFKDVRVGDFFTFKHGPERFMKTSDMHYEDENKKSYILRPDTQVKIVGREKS